MDTPIVSWETHSTETARAVAVVHNGPVDLLATVHPHGSRFVWVVSAQSRTNTAQRATWGGISDDIGAAKLAAERILYRWGRGILPAEPDQFRAVTITPKEVRDAMVAALEGALSGRFRKRSLRTTGCRTGGRAIGPLQEEVVEDNRLRVREAPASAWSGPIEPTVRFGQWQIVLFIEAGAIYDVYYAEAPDGRAFSFSHSDNPWTLLTPAQKHGIHAALGGPADTDYELQ